VLVGGRVGHVAFYDPKLFASFSSSVPFWGLLEIHRGGMSSHGAMIGIAIACIWFARHIIHAQHISMVDRPQQDQSSTEELLTAWLGEQLKEKK
ncbi:MAG: prolipoprotein diacylglyceryl transferase family protein, partial [Planctomycetaceae bacterium]